MGADAHGGAALRHLSGEVQQTLTACEADAVGVHPGAGQEVLAAGQPGRSGTAGVGKDLFRCLLYTSTYDPELLLKGLALLYQLNAPQHERHHEPRSDGERRRPRPTGRRPYNNGSSPRRRNNRRPRRDDEAKAG